MKRCGSWIAYEGSEQSQDFSSVFSQHSLENFSYGKLNDFSANKFDLYLNVSKSDPDNSLITEFLELSKDKSKFEIDAIGCDIIRISQDAKSILQNIVLVSYVG